MYSESYVELMWSRICVDNSTPHSSSCRLHTSTLDSASHLFQLKINPHTSSWGLFSRVWSSGNVFIWAEKVAASKFQRAYIFYAIYKQFKYVDQIKIRFLLKKPFIISSCAEFSGLPRKFVGSEKIQAQGVHSPIGDIPPVCLVRFWQVLFQCQGQKLDWKCSLLSIVPPIVFHFHRFSFSPLLLQHWWRLLRQRIVHQCNRP